VAQFTFYILIGGVLGLMEKRTRPSIRLLVRLGSMTSERKVLETSNWVEIFIFAHVTEVPILWQKGKSSRSHEPAEISKRRRFRGACSCCYW